MGGLKIKKTKKKTKHAQETKPAPPPASAHLVKSNELQLPPVAATPDLHQDADYIDKETHNTS